MAQISPLEELETKLANPDNEKVDLYFHQDFDGKATALFFKRLISLYPNILEVIYKEAQYGEIFNQTTPSGDVNISVDFADGFDGLDYITDHHQRTHIVSGRADLFPGARSNAGRLFETLVENPLAMAYARAADIIDSAGYAKAGFDERQQRTFTVEDIICLDPDVEPKLEHYFALNKVLLAFKNRRIGGEKFMERFLMEAESIHPLAMLYVATELALSLTKPRDGTPLLDTLDRDEMLGILQANGDQYVKKFKASEKPQFFDGGRIIYLRQPIAQMKSGSYDRYAPFEAHPDVRYLINSWPGMGLLQVSLNPNLDIGDENLKELTDAAIEEVSALFPAENDMFYFKGLIRNYRSRHDLITPKSTLLERLLEERSREMLGVQLKDRTKEELEEFGFNCWDLIRDTSGGHYAISNIPHLMSFGKERKNAVAQALVDYCVRNL